MNNQNDFIKDMSLDEKIEILLDDNLWLNSQINSSSPSETFNLFDHKEMKKDVSIFSFISRSWDLDLIKNFAEIKASKTKENGKRMVTIPFGIFNADHYSFMGFDDLIDEPFYLFKILETYIKILQDNDIYVIGLVQGKLKDEFYKILNEIKFNAIFIDDESSLDSLNKQDFILFKANENEVTTYTLKNNIIKYFHNKEQLIEAIELYNEKHSLLEESNIKESEFNELINNRSIINIDYIDNLLLRIAYFTKSIYLKQTDNFESNIGNWDDFDKIATIKSTIIYKHIKTLCSSLSFSKIYLVGDYDFDKTDLDKLCQRYFNNFQQIYNGEQSFFIDHPLSESAKSNDKAMETVIVKLNSIDDKDYLTDPQILFLKKLFQSDFNIILVLPSQIKYIEERWEKYCSMILSSKLFSLDSMEGLFEIILGEKKASGELIHPIYKTIKNKSHNLLFYGIENKSLSFTNLYINLPIIQYMIKNNSNEDEEVISKIYLNSKSSVEEEKILLGFDKTTIPKQKSKIISIEITTMDLTFYDLTLNDAFNKNYSLNVYYLDQLKLNPNHNKKHHDFKITLISANILGMPLLYLINTLLIIAFILGLMFRLNYIFFIIVFSAFTTLNLFRKFKSKKISTIKNNDTSFDLKKLQETFNDMPFAQAINQEVYEISTDDPEPEEIQVEETITILRPKELIPAEEINYSSSIDITEYLNQCDKYLKDNGLSVHVNSVKEFFSSIASSHLLLSIDNHPLVTDRFIEIFINFIGGKMFFDDLEDDLARIDTLLSEEDSGLNRCIQSAKDNTDIIHMMLINNIDLSQADEILFNIMDYARDPFVTTSLYNASIGQYIDLPKNIWFIIQPKKADRFLISNKLASTSLSYTLDYSLIEPQEVVNENKDKMSYHFLKNYTQKNKDTHYIDEFTWKKLDELEKLIKKHGPVIFDNRITREIENYTAMYLSSGGEILDAVDNVLYSKVLNMIHHLDISTSLSDDADLFSLCENLFGLENLKKSKHLLTKIKEKNLNEGDN